ncbi:MAG: zinc metallopeptidase, partial [Acidobacteria bacterium]|nr:zinc metallopeptidase [Acidobacteriota bacterium]
MFGIDPLYWMLMLPVMLLSFFASFRVKSAFKKYSQVRTAFGITGAQAARQILDRNGLNHVEVVETHGFLSDHYDPTKKVVRLSPEVYRSPSLASVGIAAHETGHAVQHAKSYAPLMLRNMMVPVASIGSNFAWIAIMAGFVIGMMGLVKIGILLFSAVVVFQLL